MYFGTFLKDNVGNNKISYEQRKKLGSKCSLYIPEIIEIKDKNNLKDFLKLGDKVVFEEVENNKLSSKFGLKNYIYFKFKNSDIYIFDNHNLSFYFIGKHFLENKKKLELIHIDQHSDLYEPYYYKNNLTNLEEIEEYCFKAINVGSWIKPLEKLGFIKNTKQIRTEFSALNLKIDNIENCIIDIDLDFWEENMATSKKSLEKIKNYIGKAPLVLIATSPYFIDQKKAINLIYKLFDL